MAQIERDGADRQEGLPVALSGGVLRRIGVLGDIHAEDRLLEAALGFLAQQQLDRILAVGDIADGPGNVDRCRELLQSHDVQGVAGNHERWLLAGQMRDLPDAVFLRQLAAETRAYLASLPKTRSFETSLGPLLLCHGLGEFDMGGVRPHDSSYDLEFNSELHKLVLEARYRFVVNGHTHWRMVRSFQQLTILNAGTLFHEHAPCFMLVDFEARRVQYHNLSTDGRILEGETILLPRPEEASRAD